MKPFGRLRRLWHRIRLQYLLMLYDGCLDEEVRVKLRREIEYHDKRLS